MSEKILDIKEERLSFFTPAGEVKALNGVSFAMNQGACWASWASPVPASPLPLTRSWA